MVPMPMKGINTPGQALESHLAFPSLGNATMVMLLLLSLRWGIKTMLHTYIMINAISNCDYHDTRLKDSAKEPFSGGLIIPFPGMFLDRIGSRLTGNLTTPAY